MKQGQLQRKPRFPASLCARIAHSALALTIVVAANLTGCEPPYANALRDEAGQPISLADIEAVLSDTELTEDDQREALRELGITNESLIDLLIRVAPNA